MRQRVRVGYASGALMLALGSVAATASLVAAGAPAGAVAPAARPGALPGVGVDGTAIARSTVGLSPALRSHVNGVPNGFLSILQAVVPGSTVAVSLNGVPQLPLGYGQVALGLVSAGTYHLAAVVTAPGHAPTAASGTVTVNAGQNVTETANLQGPTAPVGTFDPGFRTFVNDMSAPPALGQSRLTMANLGLGTPVNIFDNSTQINTGGPLVNGAGSQSVILPAGPVNLTVWSATPTPINLFTLPPRDLVAGQLVNLFVTGDTRPNPNSIGLLDTAIPLNIGYRLYASDGGVFSFGDASFHGSLGSLRLNKPIVGGAPGTFGGGYWMVGADGGVFAFGDAQFFGSTGSIHLNKPMVGMAATPDGGGYWLVASDGGIFAFGDAQFFGSTGSIHLNKPIVGMASTPDGLGYWMVASDGGVFSFGDARFFGSTGNLHLNRPMVGMTPTVDGGGYLLVASDGGVFSFGNSQYYGSTGGQPLNQPIVGIVPTSDSQGYWLVAADGGIFSYGNAGFWGSTGSLHLNRPIVFGSPPGQPLPH